MIIAGAGGHAKDILAHFADFFSSIGSVLCFYDDVSKHANNEFVTFDVLTHEAQLRDKFKINPSFVLGLGNGHSRKKLYLLMKSLGGRAEKLISKTSSIGQMNVHIGDAVDVMPNVFISNFVTIMDGTLINYRASVHHDCSIGRFCELSPSVQLLGGVCLGDFVFVGAGTTILPKISVGNNVVIGAGSLITKDIPDNSIVYGVPGCIVT